MLGGAVFRVAAPNGFFPYSERWKTAAKAVSSGPGAGEARKDGGSLLRRQTNSAPHTAAHSARTPHSLELLTDRNGSHIQANVESSTQLKIRHFEENQHCEREVPNLTPTKTPPNI